MHPYATDSSERKNVVFGLAILSVAVSYGLHLVLGKLNFRWPWWMETPSFIGIFGLFYEIFNSSLWRVKLLRKLGIVRIPDLSGKWKVEGYSAKRKENFNAEIEIKQTWTKISIVMESKFSKSHSITASILTHQPGGYMISYEYVNEPRANALPTMHSHRGTAILYLKNENLIEGEYYSGRDRENYGTLILKRGKRW